MTTHPVSQSYGVSQSYVPVTTASLSFARDIAVELRKLTNTWGMRALLLATVLSAGAVGTAETIATDHVTYGEVAHMSLLFAPYFMFAMSAALVTGERTHRTGLTTFALQPRRTRVWLAKDAAVGILLVAVVAACLAIAALVGLLAPVLGQDPVLWTLTGRHLVVDALGLVVAAGIGWALGLATGSLAVSLTLYLVWPIVAMGLDVVVPHMQGLTDWTRPDAVYGLMGEDPAAVGQTAVSLLIWLVVPAVIGLVRTVRGEIR